MKKITDGQIMRWAANGQAYAKPGERPDVAIKRFMAQRKREMRTPPRRSFPKTAMHLSCTLEYVQAYYQMNGLLPSSGMQGVRDLFEPLSTNPTTWPEGDEVEYEEVTA